MTFLFTIPITVALIHTLISSNIVYTLLNMIGINNHHIFLTSYVLAVAFIISLYMAMYKITLYVLLKLFINNVINHVLVNHNQSCIFTEIYYIKKKPKNITNNNTKFEPIR